MSFISCGHNVYFIHQVSAAEARNWCRSGWTAFSLKILPRQSALHCSAGLILSVQYNQFVQSKMQFTQSKMRNCAAPKHKNTHKEANLPLTSNLQTQKCCQLQGCFAPDPLTRGTAPGPRWGLCPQTPVIGWRSTLAINVSTCAFQNFP